jgi:hypothetical protein
LNEEGGIHKTALPPNDIISRQFLLMLIDRQLFKHFSHGHDRTSDAPKEDCATCIKLVV